VCRTENIGRRRAGIAQLEAGVERHLTAGEIDGVGKERHTRGHPGVGCRFPFQRQAAEWKAACRTATDHRADDQARRQRLAGFGGDQHLQPDFVDEAFARVHAIHERRLQSVGLGLYPVGRIGWQWRYFETGGAAPGGELNGP
jgi:hypothetical protein